MTRIISDEATFEEVSEFVAKFYDVILMATQMKKRIKALEEELAMYKSGTFTINNEEEEK